MKHNVFPYQPAKYVVGLILSWIFGFIVSMIVAFAQNDNWFPVRRVVEVLKAAFICLVPMLVICSLVRRYWLPVIIMLLGVNLVSLFVMLYWIPVPPRTTLMMHIWSSRSFLIGSLFNYLLPAAFFQQYCKWVCSLPVNQPEDK